MGPHAFLTIYNNLPEARATVATDRGTIARATCGGLEAAAESTEQGIILTAPVTVRFLLTDEPSGNGCAIGKGITVTLAKTGQSARFRITGRADTAGVVRLTAEAPR